MAQITNGSKLQFAIAATAGTKLEAETSLTWVDIADVTSIPELVGTTAALDATRIIDMAKRYIASIPDNGGNMDFGCQFTPELYDIVSDILAAQATKEVGFRVVTPSPLALQFYFKGTVAQLNNDAIETEGVINAKLSIFPATAVLTKEASVENPFKTV